MEETKSYSPHDPLDSAKQEIRLPVLQPSANHEDPIHCDLFHTSLIDPPEFEAVSYAWGDPAVTLPIYLKEDIFMVTTNLECALRHIRDPAKPRTLWIDAICINQLDLDEKSSQVAIMGNIYHRAIVCLLWLGPGPPLSPTTLQIFQQACCEELEQYKTDAKAFLLALKVEDLMAFVEEFRQMLAMPSVWRRLWIIQEVTLARRVSILYGPHKLEWPPLLPLLSALQNIAKDPRIDQPRRRAADIDLVNTSFLTVLTLRPKRLLGRQTLPEVYHHFYGVEATNPRDYIYGMLGVAFGDLGIQPDYNLTPEEVFTSFVQSKIEKHNNLDVLELAGAFPGREANLTISSMPTWVPNFPQPGTIYVPLGQGGKEAGYTAGIRSCYALAEATELVQGAKMLVLPGIRLDIVLEVTSIDTNSGHHASLNMPLPNPRPGKYFNGQSNFDACWRTLIFDVFDSELGMLNAPRRLETEDIKACRYAFSSALNQKSRFRKIREKLRGPKFHEMLEETKLLVLRALIGGSRLFWYGHTQNGYLAMLPNGTQKEISSASYIKEEPLLCSAQVRLKGKLLSC